MISRDPARMTYYDVWRINRLIDVRNQPNEKNERTKIVQTMNTAAGFEPRKLNFDKQAFLVSCILADSSSTFFNAGHDNGGFTTRHLGSLN